MTLDHSGNTLGYAPVVPQAQSAGLRLAVLFLPLLLAGGSFRSYETGKAWLRALCIACCAALWLVLNISMAVAVAAVNSF
jgi:hypothetical protein